VAVYRLFDLSLACIVGRRCEEPLAKLFMQILEVTGCRAGRFQRISALINPAVNLETVSKTCSLDELPGPYGFAFETAWVENPLSIKER
jgi:hypothetical protein